MISNQQKRNLRFFTLVLFITQGSLFAICVFFVKGFPFLPIINVLDRDVLELKSERTIYFYAVSSTGEPPSESASVTVEKDGRRLALEPTNQKIQFETNGISYDGIGIGKLSLGNPGLVKIDVQWPVGHNKSFQIAYQEGGLGKFIAAIIILVGIALACSFFIWKRLFSAQSIK